MNMSTSKEDREIEFYAWEKQWGTEEAVRIASEEWGISTVAVKLMVREWEDSVWL
jgi:hypothetical protein